MVLTKWEFPQDYVSLKLTLVYLSKLSWEFPQDYVSLKLTLVYLSKLSWEFPQDYVFLISNFYFAEYPPSTGIAVPVIKEESSLQSQRTVLEISSGEAILCIGCNFTNCLSASIGSFAR